MSEGGKECVCVCESIRVCVNMNVRVILTY